MRHLVTYEYQVGKNYWLRENKIVSGDVGIWWAQFLMDQQCPEDFRFLNAHELSIEAALTLGTVLTTV